MRFEQLRVCETRLKRNELLKRNHNFSISANASTSFPLLVPNTFKSFFIRFRALETRYFGVHSMTSSNTRASHIYTHCPPQSLVLSSIAIPLASSDVTLISWLVFRSSRSSVYTYAVYTYLTRRIFLSNTAELFFFPFHFYRCSSLARV